MIMTATVKDPENFQQYLAKTKEVAAPYGVELLFRVVFDKTLTSEDKDHRLATIVEFPRLEKINEWYGSDAYQPLIALRDEASSMEMTADEVLN